MCGLPPLQIDENITIRCLLPGRNEEQDLAGHIKNVRKIKLETKIGVEFVENLPVVEKVIAHYLGQ